MTSEHSFAASFVCKNLETQKKNQLKKKKKKKKKTLQSFSDRKTCAGFLPLSRTGLRLVIETAHKVVAEINGCELKDEENFGLV